MARRRTSGPSPALVHAGGETVNVGGTDRVQRTITAAALNVDIADRKIRKRLKGTRKDQEWQAEAWTYFDTMPIVGFAGDFIANALSRLRFYVAWQDLPSDLPSEVDPLDPPEGMDLRLYNAAAALLERLNVGQGLTEMARKAAYNLTIPGELYVVGRLDDDGNERFDAWSTSECDPSRDDERKVRIRTTPDSQVDAIEVDPATSMFIRIWRPHPQWNDLASTPMKRLLELCDELRLIRRYMRDATRTRMNAGVWMIPEEWGFSAERNRDDDHPNGIDRMEDMMIRAITTAIDDESSAASVIPIIVHADVDTLGKAVYQPFDRPFDAVAQQQRQALAEEIAGGIDLPDQVLLGLGQVKFRNAEVITDEQFKLHLEPLAIVWVRSLSVGYLYPLLEAQGFDPAEVRRISLWYDPSAVTQDPDRSQSSNFGYTNQLLAGAAWRTYNGYTDDDAPDDAELAQRQPVAAPPVGPDGQPVAPQPAPSGNGSQPVGLAAASRARDNRRVERLGPRLANSERAVRVKLQMAADAAMRQAFNKLGNKIRARQEMKAALGRVPNLAVVSHLGLERIAAMGINPQAEVQTELDRLKTRYVEIVSRHQGNVVGMIAAAASVQPQALIDRLGDRPGQAVEHSWSELETALIGLAGTELFLSQIAAEQAGADLFDDVEGEFDAAVTVPSGLIRAALSIAGGIVVAHRQAPQSMGGVAGGQFVDELFGEVGVGADGYEWLYGDAGTRTKPFEPHYDLDGTPFADFADPALANVTGWPSDQCYPGDHAYCQCEAAPRLVDRTPAFVDPVAPSTLRQRGLETAPPGEAAFAKSAVPSFAGGR